MTNLGNDLANHKVLLNESIEKYYKSISELESTISFHKEVVKVIHI